MAPGQALPHALPPVPTLALAFHDVAAPQDGLVAATAGMVDALLAFGADWREPGAPLLLHCWMGISRSPAAALVLAAALAPERNERDIAGALRRAAPEATPNALVVALADAALGRGGRLIQAAAGIGRGREARHGMPFALAV